MCFVVEAVEKGSEPLMQFVWVGNYGYYWKNIINQNKKITLPKILVYY